MSRRRKGSMVFLPWEGRNAFLTELVNGRRWRSVLLIGLGCGFLLLCYRVADERQRYRVTRAAIAEVDRAVRAFQAELGRCPRSTVELVHPPKAGAEYLRDLPEDGWGRALRVRCPGRLRPEASDVLSAGPSGDWGRDDNVM